MDNSFFFCSVERISDNEDLIKQLESYSEEHAMPIYIIDTPLGMNKISDYEFKGSIVVLIPKHKICFVNFASSEDFQDYKEDFIEDLSYLSQKYEYLGQIGRPRVWKKNLIAEIDALSEDVSADNILKRCELSDCRDERNADFLISLLIGSINDIERTGGEHPTEILDQVKKKIILFDGEQSRFIYSSSNIPQKRITIQGLAGTGKTELLLHKLKELYIKKQDSKIVFTCYNKVLARSMKKRIPDFFDFMKVEEQIKWEERLWVMHSWGSRGCPNTGVYSYICCQYNLEFYSYSNKNQFDNVCKKAIQELEEMGEISPCFDYILIDESQDFTNSFFELCEKVTAYTVYIAGDIFQDIYDRNINRVVDSDYLLNKCYRTDPKTLMFAHAVGMGLYEKPIISWLDNKGWENCGYQLNENNKDVSKFILSRVPLRRFEDVDMSSIKSIEVIDSDRKEMESQVLGIISSIIKDNPTVNAGDIAVVFLEKNKSAYEFADRLSMRIEEVHGWKVVKGYETKDSTEDAVFISNRNNIKGLEFPFVICVACASIGRNIHERNTIYMMLTRSFITSFFVINNVNKDFIATYKKAAQEIVKNGYMCLRKPSVDEIEAQNKQIDIEASEKTRSIKELAEEVFEKYPDLLPKYRSTILENISEYVKDHNRMSEGDIKARTEKMIEAYL